jgi:hypothetical protein
MRAGSGFKAVRFFNEVMSDRTLTQSRGAVLGALFGLAGGLSVLPPPWNIGLVDDRAAAM